MKKAISWLLVAIMVFAMVPIISMQEAYADASLVVTGGTYYFDGLEHKVSYEVLEDDGYSVEFSTDGGKTWGLIPPGLTEPGSIVVSVHAIKDDKMLTHEPVVLEVTTTPLDGTVVRIIAHGSDHKAPIHKTANKNSDTLTTVNEGETCNLISQSGNWFYVEYGGYKGFVYTWFVKVETPEDPGGGGEPDDPADVEIKAKGGTFIADGERHKIVAQIVKGNGYTLSYSTDGGKTWEITAPGLTEPGKITVKIRATSTKGVAYYPDDVVLKVVADLPFGTNVKIKSHGSTTKAPFRDAPGTNGNKLGTIKEGETVIYLGKYGEWFKIQYEQEVGYVYNWFLDIENVSFKPVITSQPSDAVVAEDAKAVFKVVAKGEEPLSYHWQKLESGSWTDIDGALSPMYSLTAAAGLDGSQYRCSVTDSNGTVYTKAATLKVITVAPAITVDIADQTKYAGEKVTFTTDYTGEAVSLQWYTRTSDTAEWTKAASQSKELSFTAKPSLNKTQYKCVATNPAGDDETSEATLIVISKPVILIQPTDVSVNSGDTATFTVWADGKALSILWQYRTSPSAKWKDTSAKTNTYSFTAKTSQNGYQYRACVKNAYGTEYTDVVDLKVTLVAPTIPSYGQPANIEVNLGAKATFEVEATSTDLSYAWEYYDTATSTWVVMKDKSAKKAKLTIKKTTAAQNGREYRCVVWNSEGVVTSDAATLTLVTYPVIVTEPSDVEIFAAQTAKFTVKAKGPKLKYQWYYYDDVTSSWKKVSKATKATLTLKKVKLSKDGTKYKCFIKNSYGSVWSKEVNLKVK